MAERVSEKPCAVFSEQTRGVAGTGAEILFVENIVHIDGERVRIIGTSNQRVTCTEAPEVAGRRPEAPLTRGTLDHTLARGGRGINIAGIGQLGGRRTDKRDSDISRKSLQAAAARRVFQTDAAVRRRHEVDGAANRRGECRAVIGVDRVHMTVAGQKGELIGHETIQNYYVPI